METRVSTKGQIVLPGSLRRKFGIESGDNLRIEVEGDRIVLTAVSTPRPKVITLEDPITGLPMLVLDCDNPPILTSREVEEILADFP